MKGTYFQKPLEFVLKVEGETWRQGDPLTGTLDIRNHGNQPIPLSQARIIFARGELKKVHQKKIDSAFHAIQTLSVGNESTLAPGASVSLPWTISLDRNGPITDVSTSPFLLYGMGEAPEALGHIQLIFEPHELFQEFVKSFGVGYRFVQKSRRFSKGDWVDFKMLPPDSKVFSSLEYLTLSCRFDGETIELQYEFHIKKVEATVAGVDVKKSKSNVEQRLEPHQYRVPSGRINYEHMEASIGEAIQGIENL